VGQLGDAHVGTAALGCPVERSSTVLFVAAGKLSHYQDSMSRASVLDEARDLGDPCDGTLLRPINACLARFLISISFHRHLLP